MDRVPEPGVPPGGKSALRVVARDGVPVDPLLAPKSDHPARRELPPDATLDEVIARVLTECLDHFEAHAPTIHDSLGAAEAVHQARVSLRRLRVFLRLLSARVPDPALAIAAARAKSLATALGPARDWHVFRERLEPDAEAPLEGESGYYALLDAVEFRRLNALAVGRATISSPLARQFVGDLRQAILRRSWLLSAEDLREPGSARLFASETLERLHRRIAKHFGDVACHSAKRRHRVRLEAKRARYAGEIFGPLFGKGAANYSQILAKIQDRLGESNDVETAADLLSEIESSGEVPGAAIRELRNLLARARRKSLASLKRVETRAAELEPFWR